MLTRAEAAERIGRSVLTLRDWQTAGLLTAYVDDRGRTVYDPAEVLAAGREQRRRYKERRIIPGPGRGKQHAPPNPETE